MRKISVLAMVAAMLVSASAFAALTKTANATFTPGVVTSGGVAAGLGPSTTNNDDSCDIGTAPAATLLLPYFEVDLGTAGTGRTTVFSITNVSPYAQIAHVTLWTDWSFPVLDFNIFLTGYDVQPINLYDVIARGLIGSTTGTGIGSAASPNASSASGPTPNKIASGTAGGTNPNTGTQPFAAVGTDFNGNPNFLPAAATTCNPVRIPGQLPSALAIDVRALLSTGTSTGAGISCNVGAGEVQVGGNHGGTTAIGYATIDVAALCSQRLPDDPDYYSGEILFDNVLIGDYQDINQSTTAGNYAGGNPLVHIRAIPEGGPAGAVAEPTNLPFTFYDRYTINGGVLRTIDRRQPLPSAFAARWISGSTAAFDTQYKVWREGFTTGSAGAFHACGDYAANLIIPLVEVVRFDEHENAAIAGSNIIVSPPTTSSPTLPETSRQPVSNALFPVVAASGDVGGWTYFNLSNGGDSFAVSAGYQDGVTGANTIYNATRPGFGAGGGVLGTNVFARDVSQNWVILAMFSEGRYGVDQDANWLGNGCSAAAPATTSGATGTAVGRIAPLGGVLVCPHGVTTVSTAPTSQCTGTNVTP